jgi:hypothetical protein
MLNEVKEMLEEMLDGSDIHNANDWLIRHGATIKEALLALAELDDE